MNTLASDRERHSVEKSTHRLGGAKSLQHLKFPSAVTSCAMLSFNARFSH